MRSTGGIGSLEATMKGLEDRFRRFQDFGLILGLALVITVVGSMLRFAFLIGPQHLLVVRVVFYLALILNLLGLRHCVREDSPVLGYAHRSKREIVFGAIAVFLTSILGSICFELAS